MLLKRPLYLTAGTYGLLFLFTSLYFFKLLQNTSGSLTVDEYYHIKLAYLTRTHGIHQTFPWSHFTIWRDQFFDKDFLFHLLLFPFTYGDLDFNSLLASSLFAATTLCVIHFFISEYSRPFASLACIILILLCPGFIARICCLRPITLALILYLLGLRALIRNSGLALFLLSSLFALSYNTAALLPLTSTIFYLFSRRKNPATRELVLSSWSGLLLGYLLHPNFSAIWSNLIVQNVLVLHFAWFGSRLDLIAPELLPSTLPILITNNFSTFLIFSVTIITLFRSRLVLSPAIKTLLTVSGLFFCLMLLSERFTEYWTPFSLCTCAATLAFVFEHDKHSYPWLRSLYYGNRTTEIALLLLLTLVFLCQPLRVLKEQFSRRYDSSIKHVAEWLAKNAEPGEVIFSCIWDGPVLFFHNHLQRYMAFGDPSYFYLAQPELFNLWRPLSEGRIENSYEILKTKFGVRYVTCVTSYSALCDQLLADRRVEMVFRDTRNVIFKLH